MVKKLEGKKCPNFQGECTSGLTLSNKDFVADSLICSMCSFSDASFSIYVSETGTYASG